MTSCPHSMTITCTTCRRVACRHCGADNPGAFIVDIAANCGRCSPPTYDVPPPGIEQRPSGLWVREDVAREIERTS